MSLIPKTPIPINGLVRWSGGIWPVVFRRQHPVYVWTYTVHVKSPDAALQIHWNVSQEDIVREMDLSARYRVGKSVQLGPFQTRRILGRKWDFARGQFNYTVEGSRPDRNWMMGEDELERRLKAATEEHA